MSVIRRFVQQQQRISRAFDAMLPHAFRTDGNKWFVEELVPQYLKPGLAIWDVGGGKNPLVDAARKAALQCTVVGVDIDGGELGRAPAGLYDRAIAADICAFRGEGSADLVICQALLEHVANVEEALTALASIIKPGGHALVFVPCRNALFARLNLLLPQDLKTRILYAVWPHTRRDQGFPAYYDRCTPGDFRRLAAKVGLEITAEHPYYRCSYFNFFVPFHLVWRLWSFAGHLLAGSQAAETFCMVLTKPASAAVRQPAAA